MMMIKKIIFFPFVSILELCYDIIMITPTNIFVCCFLCVFFLVAS